VDSDHQPESLSPPKKSPIPARVRRDRLDRSSLFQERRTKVRFKTLSVIAAIVSCALAIAACGGSDESSDQAASGPATGTITIWARDAQKVFMGKLVDAYNKSHKAQAKLSIIPSAQFVQKFGTAAASGTAPDVASIDLVFLPYFASQGALEDITDLRNGLPYKDSLSPAHTRLATWQDKTYALPFTAEASVLYFNKDLFKKAGLNPNKPPTNYAEIVSYAKKLRALGKDTYGFAFAGACGGCNVFEFTPHIWASGGDVLSEDGSKAMLDTPEVTDALNFYRELWTSDVMPPGVKTDSGSLQAPSFSSGKVGMTPLGAFAVSTFKEAKVNFGVAPLPGKDGGDASFAGGDEIAIPVGSKNKAGAQEFVKWATDEQAQTVLAKEGIVPVRTDLIDKIYAPLDPRNKTLGHGMATGKTPYSVVENAIFNDNNGPWIKMINQAVFTGNVEAAQTSGQQAAQALIDQGQ
jgi:multiple sugar transport system substrate-binding protein